MGRLFHASRGINGVGGLEIILDLDTTLWYIGIKEGFPDPSKTDQGKRRGESSGRKPGRNPKKGSESGISEEKTGFGR